MNQSVSALAPKGKICSLSTSLDFRVGIASGIRNVGYDEVWRTFFRSFNLTYDAELSSYLKQMDEKKQRNGKGVRQSRENARDRGGSEKSSRELNSSIQQHGRRGPHTSQASHSRKRNEKQNNQQQAK